MTLKLADIGVRVDEGWGLGGGVDAILSEIAVRLDRLVESGEGDAIDLRSLPLAPRDRELLIDALGTGEVEATLQVDGLTQVRETGIAGVWWIEHCDARGERIAEFIEVARIPDILDVAAEDIGRGAAALRERLAARRPAATTEETS